MLWTADNATMRADGSPLFWTADGLFPAGGAPSVVGMYYYDAQLAILDASMLIAPPVFVPSNAVLPGYVISQSILPGTVVPTQAQMSITVSALRVIQPPLVLQLASQPVFGSQVLTTESGVIITTEGGVAIKTEGGIGQTGTVTVLVAEPAAAVPVSYAWSWAAGGANITINSPNSASTTFTSSSPGSSGIAQCVVTDNWGATGTLYVGVHS